MLETEARRLRTTDELGLDDREPQTIGGGRPRRRWTTCRSPSTGSSATSTRSPSSAPTGGSTGTAAHASTRRASSAPSSTRTRAASTGSRPSTDDWVPKQLYLPDTNVLITRFLTPDGVGEVAGLHADPASAGRAPPPADPAGARRSRRDALPRRGASPASTTAATSTRRSSTSTASLFRSPSSRLALETRGAARLRRRTGRAASSRSAPGESATFVLEQVPETYVPRPTPRARPREAFEQTVDYWRRWLSQSPLPGAAGARWCTARR